MIFSSRMPKDRLDEYVRNAAYFLWLRRKAMNDPWADNAEENWFKARERIVRVFGEPICEPQS
jgi:hypothetical protein